MLKSKQLREFYPMIQYRDVDIDLEIIQLMISKLAKAVDIPVAFQKDEVSAGGILESNSESCLVLYHPEHQWDYFKFCIRVTREGSYTFIMVNDFGQSKQMKKLNKVESYKTNRSGQAWGMVFNPAYTIGSMVGSAVGQGVTSIGMNKHKIEAEQRYYQCIADILDELFVKEHNADDPIWKNIDIEAERQEMRGDKMTEAGQERTDSNERNDSEEYDAASNFVGFLIYAVFFAAILLVIKFCLES